MKDKNIYFCLDQSKKFTIADGSHIPSSRLMIDIYSCQPGGAKPCNITMKTNDMLISTFVYEKTANIRDYQDPISQVNREVNMIIPSAGLRYDRKYHLGWTDIITDKGF